MSNAVMLQHEAMLVLVRGLYVASTALVVVIALETMISLALHCVVFTRN